MPDVLANRIGGIVDREFLPQGRGLYNIYARGRN